MKRTEASMQGELSRAAWERFFARIEELKEKPRRRAPRQPELVR